MTVKKIIKNHRANLTPKPDIASVKVAVDDSTRLREITALVKANNSSTLSTELIVCQIYMESRFDKNAGKGKDARGLMQLQLNAVKQIYKYRKQKSLGKMPSDTQTKAAFKEGEEMHNDPKIFDEATNIKLGTEYMDYWVETTDSIETAYKKYRGKGNGIYYSKIKSASDELKKAPNSMQILLDMVSIK